MEEAEQLLAKASHSGQESPDAEPPRTNPVFAGPKPRPADFQLTSHQMANGKNKHYVSFWFWMFALFVMALPCIGFIMVIVWAFVGENESRKNYFRACIAWFLILAAIWAGLMVLGFWPHWPEIQKQIQTWLHRK